jgi:hypothetical protein
VVVPVDGKVTVDLYGEIGSILRLAAGSKNHEALATMAEQLVPWLRGPPPPLSTGAQLRESAQTIVNLASSLGHGGYVTAEKSMSSWEGWPAARSAIQV